MGNGTEKDKIYLEFILFIHGVPWIIHERMEISLEEDIFLTGVKLNKWAHEKTKNYSELPWRAEAYRCNN